MCNEKPGGPADGVIAPCVHVEKIRNGHYSHFTKLTSFNADIFVCSCALVSLSPYLIDETLMH